ncbi:transglutaminase domain-containing protein [Dokdonia sp.]|uniref:transglutaminase domain-containing protein n=1 Tax=Dokdonia sp. TaxID=2024995 RepID=UPI0032651167
MNRFILLVCFTFIVPLHAQRSDFNKIDFTKAEHIANRYKGEDLTNLPLLVHHLTSQLETDAERFKAIYYWVSHNISGNYDLMHTNERTRKKLKNDPEELQRWNHQFKKEVFTKLLSDKETLCTGYAYLIKVLSNLAGLECTIIHGYDLNNSAKSNKQNGPNHSWNAIKLNGKWYLCDATWSAGYTDMSNFLFEFEYDNTYFLMKPSEFVKTHKPLDEKWTLLPLSTEVHDSKKKL